MANYSQTVSALRAVFRSGRTKSLEWRRTQLQNMLTMLDENKEQFCDVIKQDLNKSKFEFMVMELDLTRNELINILNNLTEWTSPEKVKKGLLNIMDSVYIRREPLGVSLVIAPWNYPIQTTLLPMMGAIAAGNCVVLKPSELCVNTSGLMKELFPKYFDTEAIMCINGGIPETTALLQEKWDIIFYTGSSAVGKIIARAAAEHLTPVILELGGKTPVYVDEGTDLGVVANRIIWGKCSNAGQICIAPDYIMCTKETQDALVEKFKATLEEFYPDGAAKSPDYGRIVNDRHFQRIKKLLDETKGTVVTGGDMIESERFIAPTVLSDVTFTDPIMESEIFGPLLPIIPVANVDEAISYIVDGEKPLAFYIYSTNRSVTQKLIENVSSGGVCVNDSLMQASIPSLPFGGVGNSGTGSYHGRFSVEAFSHKRACMERDLKMESVNNVRYPPFTNGKMTAIKILQGHAKKPRNSETGSCTIA